MNSLITLILIGISLSMDAFSLAIIYGIIGINYKDKVILSIIVGLYHFFMPQIGLRIGKIITKIPFINLNKISPIILIIIGMNLIFSKYNPKEELKTSKIGYLLFGLYVSLDSMSVGIGLKTITSKYILSSIIFSIISCLFTYIGVNIGNKIKNKTGSYSRILGGIILLIIGIYFLNVFTN